MLSFNQALAKVLESVEPLEPVRVPLEESLGCVLTEDISTPFPLPRFNASAMDGYGVRLADFASASPEHPVPVIPVATVHAGDLPAGVTGKGNAVRIMTGAPVPPEVEAVVMREDIEGPEGLFLRRPVRQGENIRPAGQEHPAGAKVLAKGTMVTPPVIGTAATLGLAELPVHRPPTAAVIVTGDELVEPGTPVTANQIYNSNLYALVAALKSLDVKTSIVTHCRDRLEEIESALSRALDYADVVVTSGGVSMGERDLVREAARRQGVGEVFWKVSLKPGKPVFFGTVRRRDKPRWLFGLPGNPVSVLVTFQLFVKPALGRLKGLQPLLKQESAVLSQYYLNHSGRLEFVRARLKEEDGRTFVEPLPHQDSHMTTGLAWADCLVMLEPQIPPWRAGQTVSILRLDWSGW